MAFRDIFCVFEGFWVVVFFGIEDCFGIEDYFVGSFMPKIEESATNLLGVRSWLLEV